MGVWGRGAGKSFHTEGAEGPEAGEAARRPESQEPGSGRGRSGPYRLQGGFYPKRNWNPWAGSKDFEKIPLAVVWRTGAGVRMSPE